jgi:protein-L-isoaspartate(D-aspartate) O-methyltransferase
MTRGADAHGEDRFEKARRDMVSAQLAARGIKDSRVLDAFLRVPRHAFIPQAPAFEAYADHPLSIGSGQTISQPYIVALMTQALALTGNEKVLEVSTGSGYQTAILAELAARVYTVERLPELAAAARKTLDDLGYGNIEFRTGDGTLGLPEHAPYDCILVGAAAPEVPKSLIAELAVGGRLVIPVGGQYSQMLRLVTRERSQIISRELCPCIFVKLIGREAFDEA